MIIFLGVINLERIKKKRHRSYEENHLEQKCTEKEGYDDTDKIKRQN